MVRTVGERWPLTVAALTNSLARPLTALWRNLKVSSGPRGQGSPPSLLLLLLYTKAPPALSCWQTRITVCTFPGWHRTGLSNWGNYMQIKQQWKLCSITVVHMDSWPTVRPIQWVQRVQTEIRKYTVTVGYTWLLFTQHLPFYRLYFPHHVSLKHCSGRFFHLKTMTNFKSKSKS